MGEAPVGLIVKAARFDFDKEGAGRARVVSGERMHHAANRDLIQGGMDGT